MLSRVRHVRGFHDFALTATETGQRYRVTTEKLVQRTIIALRRGPIRHHRDQVIVCEGDPADYIFLVMEGVVRSCRTFQSGARNILGFYLPGELFGWTDLKHALSVEAATDTMILYLKRSALLSITARDSRIASFLLGRNDKRASTYAGACLVDRQKREMPFGNVSPRSVQQAGKDKVPRSSDVSSGHRRSPRPDHRDGQPHHHRTGTIAAGCPPFSSDTDPAEPSIALTYKKLRNFSGLTPTRLTQVKTCPACRN